MIYIPHLQGGVKCARDTLLYLCKPVPHIKIMIFRITVASNYKKTTCKGYLETSVINKSEVRSTKSISNKPLSHSGLA